MESTSIQQRPQAEGSSKLTIGDFDRILATTAAFGDRAAFNEVGSFSEDGYQNPEVIAGTENFGYMRALKAHLRGDDTEALREGKAAFSRYRDNSHAKPGVAAFLSLLDKDADGFRKNIEARLVTHKKQYQRLPNDPKGYVCLHGMALCRLAIDRGLWLPEGPYLPLRFLTNWKPRLH